MVQHAARVGARVMALDVDASKLETARAMGAHFPLDTAGMSDAERVASDMLRYDTVEEIKGYMFACLRELELIELVEAFN